ncbi:MAG: hypothetical protein AAGF73_01990 [Actinomycetota bacterium]
MQQNLEDHWLALLEEIMRSEAMIAWTAAANDPARAASTSLQRWIADRTVGPSAGLLGLADDADLLARLAAIDFPLDTRGGFDAASIVVNRALVDEIGFRAQDPRFADELAALALTNATSVAALTTALPDAALTTIAMRLLSNVSWVDDAPTAASAHGASAVIGQLADRDPAALLSVLTDRDMLITLGTWPMLDQEIIARAVGAALHDAVIAEPGLLDRGLDAVATIAALAPTTFDDGMRPGLATGVAAALPVYLPAIGPAIRNEGTEPVRVVGANGPRTLATYDELRELIGALGRHDEALVIVAMSLAAYTIDVIAEAGPDLATAPGVEYPAQVADLVRDALDDEHREAAASTATSIAAQRQHRSLLGAAATVVVNATQVSRVLRTVTSFSLGPIDAQDPSSVVALPDRSITAEIYDTITVETLRVAAATEHLELDPTDRQTLVAAIALVDAAGDDLGMRRRAIIDAEYVARQVPAAGGFLSAARQRSGVDELREDRRPDD